MGTASREDRRESELQDGKRLFQILVLALDVLFSRREQLRHFSRAHHSGCLSKRFVDTGVLPVMAYEMLDPDDQFFLLRHRGSGRLGGWSLVAFSILFGAVAMVM